MKKQQASKYALKYQAKMMNKIAKMVGGKKILLHWIKENLGLSNASAYRRLSGDTLFNLEEIIMIISNFKIPVTV